MLRARTFISRLSVLHSTSTSNLRFNWKEDSKTVFHIRTRSTTNKARDGVLQAFSIIQSSTYSSMLRTKVLI